MMKMNPQKSIYFNFTLPTFALLLSTACGGGGGSGNAPPQTNDVTQRPSNKINHAYFRDIDGDKGKLAGIVTVDAFPIIDDDPARTESVWVYWAGNNGSRIGNPILKTSVNAIYDIKIPVATEIPSEVNSLLLYPSNGKGQAEKGTLIPFHDFAANIEVSGPGGNASQSWYYGTERAKISVFRTSDGRCIFDNGLVSVIDMANTKDESWESTSGRVPENTVDDAVFPPYEFLCGNEPVNTHREVSDEYGVWTYSTINDSMHYGLVVYDSFVKYLGEPPLDEKIRLRVHYGSQSSTSVYWDGSYANFGDGIPFQYSMASLDSIAHEVGHGVLNRISNLNIYHNEVSTDVRTLHEAFSDLAGVMAKYEYYGHPNNWIHGEESEGAVRRLNQIKTEFDAIDSFLDYQDAGDNYYLRIGMITYPFHLLSEQWGLEATYKVYLGAARNCWSAMSTLTDAAACIKQQAIIDGFTESDVIDAFKAVKIKLFDDGVLSHFNSRPYKLRVEFTDDSRSTSQTTEWLWDFGDGQISNQANPEHVYETSGNYQVRLTVIDQSGDQDSFERSLSVTDQYCAIRENSDVENSFTSVNIAGTNINYENDQWDYTQSTIELESPENVVIDIKGDKVSTERSIIWRIWIDLNEDGIFGDEEQELVLDVSKGEGEAYELMDLLDLSELSNDGSAKRMRIIGKYALFSPCYSSVGEAIDVRVKW
ncbi:MAG: PKD domain-containing protein [Kangiellaceae bacterium]|nr:PKD domain-containing protein [Kangiellaceae bacterium]